MARHQRIMGLDGGQTLHAQHIRGVTGAPYLHAQHINTEYPADNAGMPMHIRGLDGLYGVQFAQNIRATETTDEDKEKKKKMMKNVLIFYVVLIAIYFMYRHYKKSGGSDVAVNPKQHLQYFFF
jgi:hypothetical protein